MSIWTQTATGPPAPDRKRIKNPTPQQLAIFDHCCDQDSHLLIEARAGSGKSTSCCEAMCRVLERRPATSIRYAVFSKSARADFEEKAPMGVEARTLNSFGNQMLWRAFKPRMEKNKTVLLLAKIGKFSRAMKAGVKELVSKAKGQNVHPGDPRIQAILSFLFRHYAVPGDDEKAICDLSAEVLKASWQDLSQIDFDDQVWLPGVLELMASPCDMLFVDEAQDLNPTQHALVSKLCPSGRTIAVGDRFQSLYAFRGAASDSMPLIKAHLEKQGKAALLPLSVSFRCPVKHIRLAQTYVPDIEAMDGAPDGVLHRELPWEVMLEEANPGDMVICPLNAPLTKVAVSLYRMGKTAAINGRPIGASLLVAIIDYHSSVADMRNTLHERCRKELKGLGEDDEEEVSAINDRYEMYDIILSACRSISDVRILIDKLFVESEKPSPNTIFLSTVHRAKGLEAGTVWFLDYPLWKAKSAEERQQQRNLRYVAVTRSWMELNIVKPHGS